MLNTGRRVPYANGSNECYGMGETMRRTSSWVGAALVTAVQPLFPGATGGEVNSEAEAEHGAAVVRLVEGLLILRAEWG